MLFLLIERFKDRDTVYQNYRRHGLGDGMKVSINDCIPKLGAPRLIGPFSYDQGPWTTFRV